ncbi:hypothetical protein J421_2835 [Gemmatirosa kalamazoonensis]|uniref:Uncharacterized protein n=1 Tax=Gemmatirosa kalamazoonensis TaxID=861299 RepID=W0RIV8_9BACT|nr:hypothetical protein [Gemmatirosa kalamazoonensis]AHG90372.1 hypothetical protein J421_2835 [Gemmatirosa kalamazoonensis]
MSKYTRLRTPLLAALAALATGAAACGGDRKNDALSQDTALSRDLAMAGSDTSAQPQLQDVPANTPPATTTPPTTTATAPAPAPTPAPTRTPARPRTTTSSSSGTTVRTRTPPPPPAPRPTTSAPAPAPAKPTVTASGNTVTPNAGGAGAAERSNVGSIPAGTTLALRSNSKVCTNTNHVGERFTATLSSAVSGSNGVTIPAGSQATVEITQLKRSENANDKIQMGFRVISITFGGHTYAVDATTQSAEISRVRNEPASKDRQKVIGGAIAGAIAGQILGKDTKGTVIGAATGAAAGAAAAAATANYEGCLNDGADLSVKLNEATQVRM